MSLPRFTREEARDYQKIEEYLVNGGIVFCDGYDVYYVEKEKLFEINVYADEQHPESDRHQFQDFYSLLSFLVFTGQEY